MLHSLREWEEKCVVLAGKIFPSMLPHLRRYQRLLRYLTAGGTAAAIDFILLYLFTDVAGIHYLLSSILAFLIAFVVSFILQKFWTFQDHSTNRVPTQATLYFVVAAANLLLNTLLMYVFVDALHLWYLFAQQNVSARAVQAFSDCRPETARHSQGECARPAHASRALPEALSVL